MHVHNNVYILHIFLPTIVDKPIFAFKPGILGWDIEYLKILLQKPKIDSADI